MKFQLIIIIFFLLSGFFIISEENLALKERENIHKFTDSYLNWIGKIYDNSVSFSGYIVKMDWLPDTKA